MEQFRGVDLTIVALDGASDDGGGRVATDVVLRRGRHGARDVAAVTLQLDRSRARAMTTSRMMAAMASNWSLVGLNIIYFLSSYFTSAGCRAFLLLGRI